MNQSVSFFSLGFVLCSCVFAQDAGDLGTSGIGRERARIDIIRQEQGALFDAQERACQARFAATGCVNDVSARRRAQMSELKRQEAELNAMERRQRAADELQQLDKKALERSRNDADRAADVANHPQDERQQRQDEKVREHAKSASTGYAQTKEPKVPSQPKELDENRAAYQRKLAEAVQRKRDFEQKNSKKKADESVPLPLPQ